MHYLLYVRLIFLSFQLFSHHSNGLDPHKVLEANKDAKRLKNGLVELGTSHKYLNDVLRWRKEAQPRPLEYEYSQLPHGYSHRKEFRNLLNQRDHHEDKIGPLIQAGKVWHRENNVLSQIMLSNARQHRSNSQTIQHKMNTIREKAQLDPYFHKIRAGTSSGDAHRRR